VCEAFSCLSGLEFPDVLQPHRIRHDPKNHCEQKDSTIDLENEKKMDAGQQKGRRHSAELYVTTKFAFTKYCLLRISEILVEIMS
jgi:hypothetical protein